MPESTGYSTYFDEAWKKVIERFFPQFILFFAPNLHKDVDFSQPFTFLDKEMQEVTKEGLKGAKFVDKLVKIYLKDGTEQWLLVHIEVQGEADRDFSLRMYRYFNRIFERYGKPIVSMAVVTGPANWKPSRTYEFKYYGSGVEFQYLLFRLSDFDRDKLLADDNPIALVVLAAQDAERHRRRSQERYDVKWRLIRLLYQRNYTRKEIVELFEFIDWVLQLSDGDEQRLWQDINNLEEVNRMPYITSVERIGIQKGYEQGIQQGVQQGFQQGKEQGIQEGVQQTFLRLILETLDERFGDIPSSISDEILQIKDHDQLRILQRQANRSRSIDDFCQQLRNQTADS